MDIYLRSVSKSSMRLLIFAMAAIITVITPQICYGQEGKVLLFEAADIAEWVSSIAPGTAELTDDGFALVSSIGGWGGGVASPWLEVDFARSLVLIIKVHDISDNWTLKLAFNQRDDQWGPYIQGDNPNAGEFSYDLPDALNSFPGGVEPPDPEDTADVQIRIWGTGAEEAKVWVESIILFYKDDPNDRPRFIDPELEEAYAGENSPVEPRAKLNTFWGAIKAN